MGPREREGGEELQPVMKKLRLGDGSGGGGGGVGGSGEGGEEVRRGQKRRLHPETECTGETKCYLEKP